MYVTFLLSSLFLSYTYAIVCLLSSLNMRNLPIIIGLPTDGKLTDLYRRITRTQLFNFALILFGFLSVLFFFLLIIQGHKHRHENINKYCLSEGCLLASVYQLQLMNKSARNNRCRDFYNYACGGWEQTHAIDSIDLERTIFSEMINERNAHLYRLLNSPIIHQNSRSWEWKVKVRCFSFPFANKSIIFR